MTEAEIFLAASQIDSLALRAAFLDSVCRDDRELRKRVDVKLEKFLQFGNALDEFPDQLGQRVADIRREDLDAGEADSLPNKPTSPPALSAGNSFQHFNIVKCLGVGGMGEVYLATDTRLGRRVAIKILPALRTHDEAWIRRFTVEAKAVSQLNHPNILTIYEVGFHENQHYMVTEFVDGQSLRDVLNRSTTEPATLLRHAIDIAKALEAAHTAGIIHRDLKPDNIMVRKDGLLKVLDFGLAKQFDHHDDSLGQSTLDHRTPVTEPHIMLGTLRYMSPEQVRRQSLDYRSDMFSFGVLLYEMFCGRLPFTGSCDVDIMAGILQAEPTPMPANLPDDLKRLVGRLLRKDRTRRLFTAREVIVELELIEETQLAKNATERERSSFAQQLTDPARSDDTAEVLLAIPEVRYARSGEVNIAYQVLGAGEIDIVFVMGWVSHLDWFWKHSTFASFLRRLAKFSRLILFDKRGTGLSDRVPTEQLPTLEQRMDDVRAVMEAVGSERAVLCGVSEGGPMSALFAATYPDKTTALVMIGCYARRLRAEDYPWGPSQEQHARFLEDIRQNWGGPVGIEARAPSLAMDAEFRSWWATYLRMGASPGAVLALTKMNSQIDIRHVLPTIRVPTLVIHRRGDQCLKVEEGKYLADNIPGAKFVELPGDDHLPFVGRQAEVLEPIEEFLTGVKHDSQIKRVLATVLEAQFIPSSTGGADQIALAHAVREVELFRGKRWYSKSGSIEASFDGPARAVRAAMAMQSSAQRLGVIVRIAVHTGECEAREDQLSGPAVVGAQWLLERAQPDQILVSNTVKDLVAGSDLPFQLQEEVSNPGSMPRLIYRVGRDL